MELFDSHFHYRGGVTQEQYVAELPEDISFSLMAVGGGMAESIRAMEFAQVVENSYFSCGIHPLEVTDGDIDYDQFSRFYRHPKLKAIGELGIDLYYSADTLEYQRRAFDRFLTLALEWGLPVIVHCRDREDRGLAYDTVYGMLREFCQSGGVADLHCFAGSVEWAERFLALGCYIGITGMVTFAKSDNIRALARMVPDDRLLIETDAPYLAPIPFRGKENHPKYLQATAEFVARLRGVTPEALGTLTADNARRWLKIG